MCVGKNRARAFFCLYACNIKLHELCTLAFKTASGGVLRAAAAFFSLMLQDEEDSRQLLSRRWSLTRN